MFEDALKTSGYEGQFIVRELIELIDECMEYAIPEHELLVESVTEAIVIQEVLVADEMRSH
jgi:hypothetical protein